MVAGRVNAYGPLAVREEDEEQRKADDCDLASVRNQPHSQRHPCLEESHRNGSQGMMEDDN